MKGKGFTLIELLAVIVVLAIIMVIATPIVVKTIDDAKKGAFKNTAYGIMKAAEQDYFEKIVKGQKPNEIIYEYVDGKEASGETLEFKGTIPQNGKIVVNREGKVALAIHDGTYCAIKAPHKEEVEIAKKKFEDCEVPIPPYVDKSGANAPQLITGMTPVIWNGNDWVEPSNINDPYEQDWYDYANQKWANAKTEDGSFWVWIPRYAYSITSGYHTSTAGTIDIKFLNGITNTTNDGTKIETSGYETGVKDTSMHYFKHPAFTFGNDEIEGFWVAKFEPSGTSSNISILPNATSLRSMTIGDQFDAAYNMRNNSKYGWNASDVDTHMMKNTEWGAVAYLSKSVYGANAEIWNNSNNSYKTGCAGSSVSATDEGLCNEYHTETGQKASTTHNIYGIYDMSGGAYERVAAYVDNGHGNLSSYGQSILDADLKYKNVYVSSGDTQSGNYTANKNTFGDAVYETSSSGSGSNSWYSDNSYIPSSSAPWFARGGGYSSGTYAGVFYFGSAAGNSSSNVSFRPVLALP